MTNIRSNVVVGGVLAAVFLAGAVAGSELGDEDKPDCPTEDSCTVDYRDGGWVIEETTP